MCYGTKAHSSSDWYEADNHYHHNSAHATAVSTVSARLKATPDAGEEADSSAHAQWHSKDESVMKKKLQHLRVMLEVISCLQLGGCADAVYTLLSQTPEPAVSRQALLLNTPFINGCCGRD